VTHPKRLLRSDAEHGAGPQTRRVSRATPVVRARRGRLALTIAAPCAELWEAMAGGDRVRHCESCNRPVYNLSPLTKPQAVALVVPHWPK
jgi:hypothetical protein